MKFELASERRVSWNVECPFFPKNAVKQWPRAKLLRLELLLRVDISSYYDLSYSLKALELCSKGG